MYSIAANSWLSVFRLKLSIYAFSKFIISILSSFLYVSCYLSYFLTIFYLTPTTFSSSNGVANMTVSIAIH